MSGRRRGAMVSQPLRARRSAPAHQLRARPSMKGKTYANIAALVVAAGLAAAPSALADDPAHGAELAQQWCMGCHVLPGHPEQTALQGPPSFREIARGKAPDQIRVFLLKPHGA